MTIKLHNVRVAQYFFPETNVRALETHDPAGTKHGTQHTITHRVEEIPAQENRHGVTVTVESDDEQSENAPYAYKIVAFGLFEPDSSETEESINDYLNNVEVVAVQVLFGAIREHLAAVTARGPWGTFIVSALNIEPAKSENIEVTTVAEST